VVPLPGEIVHAGGLPVDIQFIEDAALDGLAVRPAEPPTTPCSSHRLGSISSSRWRGRSEMQKPRSAKDPETTLFAQRHPRAYLIQWERTLRWRRRSADAVAHDDPQEAFDFLFALFTNILHVRDWIVAARRDLEEDVLAFYRGSPQLALIRDIANGSKHMTLTAYSVDGAATVARAYAGNGRSRFVILRPGGRNVDAIQLADAAILEIRDLMQTKGLM
jgi:hypothetical protein